MIILTSYISGLFSKALFRSILGMLLLLLSHFVLAQNQNSSYMLAAGDIISISVYEEADLSFQVEIGESGNITYPFIGEINASNISTNGLETLIARKLIDGEFLVHPDVSVNIVEYRPFYIGGEVEAPGSYPFEPGLTLRKAVTLAGGFTERASRSKIFIIAEDSPASTEPPQVDSLEIDVNPGDIITVEQRFF
jgi:polysaccharide biosynthesis/export protein VpsN